MNLFKVIPGCLAGLLLFACSSTNSSPPSVSTIPPSAKELIFYNWVDYMPQTVLDAFTAEYGVKVKYVTYETLDEAIQNIKSGMPFDVAVVEHDLIPDLASSTEKMVPRFGRNRRCPSWWMSRENRSTSWG